MEVSPTRICQIEIPVADLEKAAQFFELAFGWQQAPAEMHEYAVMIVPDDCPFGISLIPAKSKHSGDGVTVYFAVDDPNLVVEKVESAGGRLRFGPKNLGIYGEIWQVEDLDGNRFGLHSKRK